MEANLISINQSTCLPLMLMLLILRYITLIIIMFICSNSYITRREVSRRSWPSWSITQQHQQQQQQSITQEHQAKPQLENPSPLLGCLCSCAGILKEAISQIAVCGRTSFRLGPDTPACSPSTLAKPNQTKLSKLFQLFWLVSLLIAVRACLHPFHLWRPCYLKSHSLCPNSQSGRDSSTPRQDTCKA